MRRAVITACLVVAWPAAGAQQPPMQPTSWSPPPPCTGASVGTGARRGALVIVPDLNGVTVGRAKMALANVRLEIDARTAVQDGPPDVAIGQSPQPGSVVAVGDSVIVCSRVPQRAAAGSRLPRGGTAAVVVGMASPISKLARAQPPKPSVPPRGDAPPTEPPEPRIIIVREPPIPPSLWKWLTGAIALLMLGLLARRLRRQPELKTLRVTPHRDQGNPRVVIAIHADTSGND